MRVRRAVHAAARRRARGRPRCTLMCLPFGIRYSRVGLADRRANGVMMTLRLPLVSLPNEHHAVDLADDRVVLRLAGLEELGHARQTAGDVLASSWSRAGSWR